ncbi:glycoside hydrolase TIM-barrel-like domain-containing protein [Rhodovulum sulfidophilum]|nr:glycoside hydrolase TIM-barrel-like domain-containing protein [Rhodovulum sulfidophilum]
MHGADQVAKIAASMAEFGWTVPCLVGEDGELIAGHGRVLAATQLGLTEAPVIVLGHLTEAQRRAYRIADNKLTELGSWDEALLSAELQDLLADDYDLSLVGFDAFLIGTEMRGLTTIRSGASAYPAVQAFRDLAADVRSILGPDTAISYAADWSEYFGHQPGDGSGDVFFHLDPLWSDGNVDFVGIDNYMPLSDWRDGFEHADAAEGWPAIYDRAYLQANIAGGEGYDWFYASAADRTAQVRTPITDGAAGKPWVFRYKDLRAWWSNAHYDRIGGVESGTPTAWAPESKPIWFTELGCPAIDRGTNQPNVFFDPKSSESFVPYFSRGWRDDAIQRAYLEATYLFWGYAANNPVSSVYGGRMVHVPECAAWTWDARPYPFFPALTDVWTDGANWRLGHWLTGRLSLLDRLHFACAQDTEVLDLQFRMSSFAIAEAMSCPVRC